MNERRKTPPKPPGKDPGYPSVRISRRDAHAIAMRMANPVPPNDALREAALLAFTPEPMAPDRGGNALALPIIFSFMLVAFCAGFAVGWWAWS